MLTLDKIYHASYVLKDVIRQTNIVQARGICDDCDVYLKPENLQITGSVYFLTTFFHICRISFYFSIDSCECASPARSAFYFIGSSFGISYETKKNYPHHVKDNSFLFYIMLLTSILLSVSSWSSGLRLRILLHRQRRLPTYWPCRGLPG